MKLFRRKTEEEAVRQEIAVKEAAPFEGLTEAEAALDIEALVEEAVPGIERVVLDP